MHQLVFLTALLAAELPQPAAPIVTDVVAERTSFKPAGGEKATWLFRTTATGKVTVDLYDARNVLVRTLQPGTEEPRGDHRISWDGRDDSGRLAPPGYYLVVIELESGGKKVRHDPSDSTGGNLVQASVTGYDPGKGVIRYALPRPSLVRILLGMKDGGPLLNTPVDWVAEDAGEHVEAWDGWDASRAVRFGTSPKLDIQVWAYELPVNSVIVRREEAGGIFSPGAARANPTVPVRMSFLDFPEDRPVRERQARRGQVLFDHWSHDRARCHNPVAVLKAPASSNTDDGAALVKGPLAVSLELSGDETSFLLDERFEVVIYLDGGFVFEVEQGYLPFTWTLQPHLLTPGEHVLTLMLRGYEGHFGSASLRVSKPGTPGPERATRR